MDYQNAITLLNDPKTWKLAARALVEIGDPHALLSLIDAYEMRVEGNRQSLLKAMRAFTPEEQIPDLYDQASSDEQRRQLVHLMELFPSERYWAQLAEAAASGDADLRYQAGRSLYCQPRCEEWEQVMRSLLLSPDARLRAWVIDGLSTYPRDTVRQALRAHLNHETNPDLQQKIRTFLVE